MVIGLGSDQQMYHVTNLPADTTIIDAPNSDRLVLGVGPMYGEQHLEIFNDILSRLVRTTDPTYGTVYEIGGIDHPDYILQRPDGQALAVGPAEASSNGKWMVVEAFDAGLFRLNIETHDLLRVSNTLRSPDRGGEAPYADYAISGDGKVIAVGGPSDPPLSIVEVNDICGDTGITNDMSWDTPMVVSCDTKSLDSFVRAHDPGYSSAMFLKLNDDGHILEFARNGDEGWTTIQATGYAPACLEYLAMGDSYSSGEGDISNHYLSYTNQGRDNCHVSSLSYPFLLRGYWHIQPSDMQSVACSGARMTADYFSSNKHYPGQGGRLSQYDSATRDSKNRRRFKSSFPAASRSSNL